MSTLVAIALVLILIGIVIFVATGRRRGSAPARVAACFAFAGTVCAFIQLFV